MGVIRCADPALELSFAGSRDAPLWSLICKLHRHQAEASFHFYPTAVVEHVPRLAARLNVELEGEHERFYGRIVLDLSKGVPYGPAARAHSHRRLNVPGVLHCVHGDRIETWQYAQSEVDYDAIGIPPFSEGVVVGWMVPEEERLDRFEEHPFSLSIDDVGLDEELEHAAGLLDRGLRWVHRHPNWTIGWFAEAASLLAAHGLGADAALVELFRIGLVLDQGLCGRADELSAKVRADFAALGRPLDAARSQMLSAEACLEAGLYGEAAMACEMARQPLLDSECVLEVASCDMLWAQALASMGVPEDALRLYRQAHGFFRRGEQPLSAARCDLARANLLRELPRFGEGFEALDGARTRFHEWAMMTAVAECEVSRGHLLRDVGDLRGAIAAYRSAETYLRSDGVDRLANGYVKSTLQNELSDAIKRCADLLSLQEPDGP